jgi:hypothetical protein
MMVEVINRGGQTTTLTNLIILRFASLYNYQRSYSLVATDAGYRIAAICHNQIPRLLACVARVSPAAI